MIIAVLVLLTACASTFKRIDAHKDDLYFWPKTFGTSSGESLTIYQPQVLAWPKFESIKVKMVLSYQAKPATQKHYGSAVLSANTAIDRPSKNMKLTQLAIETLSIANIEKAELQNLQTAIQKILPEDGLVMSLDRVTANFQRNIQTASSAQFKTDAPKVFISEKPSALLMFDGKPIWGKIKETSLEFALNTN